MKRTTIAVMNTKGGVGKSTLVLALAETLTAIFNKTVLVIDSDSQASVSSMLMTSMRLHKLQSDATTIVDLLANTVLQQQPLDWPKYVVGGSSDIDDASGLYLIPSDMQLTLFEREVSKEAQHGALRHTIQALLNGVRSAFDIVLIDCPPGLSVLTESWLREADFHISPTKPDYISVCGLEVFRRFKALNPEMGFAENLGVVVNLMDPTGVQDRDYDAWLRERADNRCFTQPIHRSIALQHITQFSPEGRSWLGKYPGAVGAAIKAVSLEVVQRVDAANAAVEPADGAAPKMAS
jgi:chromosome partitioning protein